MPEDVAGKALESLAGPLQGRAKHESAHTHTGLLDGGSLRNRTQARLETSHSLAYYP